MAGALQRGRGGGSEAHQRLGLRVRLQFWSRDGGSSRASAVVCIQDCLRAPLQSPSNRPFGSPPTAVTAVDCPGTAAGSPPTVLLAGDGCRRFVVFAPRDRHAAITQFDFPPLPGGRQCAVIDTCICTGGLHVVPGKKRLPGGEVRCHKSSVEAKGSQPWDLLSRARGGGRGVRSLDTVRYSTRRVSHAPRAQCAKISSLVWQIYTKKMLLPSRPISVQGHTVGPLAAPHVLQVGL